MREVTVLMDVKEISVKFEVNEKATDKEILEQAKKEYIKQISSKFPAVTYNISNGDTLDFSNVYVGKVVKDSPNGSYGVITKVNAKTIYVSFQKGMLKGHPSAFEPAEEKIDAEKIMWERHESQKKLDYWSVGDVAYLVDKKENKIVPVVLAKTTGGKYQFFRINEKINTYYNLPESYLKIMIFDTGKEAELQLKK